MCLKFCLVFPSRVGCLQKQTKKKKNISLSGPSPTAVAKCDRLGEMGAETPSTLFKLKCFTFGEEG